MAEQQKHLIDNDLEGLKDSIRKINLLAQKFMTLEKARKEIIKRILEKSRIGKNDINFNNLMARFKGRNLQELERLRNTILDTHVKATIQKERSKQLIKQSMNSSGHHFHPATLSLPVIRPIQVYLTLKSSAKLQMLRVRYY